jgi:hypothetical protein
VQPVPPAANNRIAWWPPRVGPSAWLFLVLVAAFNLLLDFVALLGTTTFADLSLSFPLNAVILIYALLPGTKEAFGLPG